MVKKLLSVTLLFLIFMLASGTGYAQCPTSVSISADPGPEVCEGTEVTFTATATGGSGYTYEWYKNTSKVIGETGSTYTPTTLSNGDTIKVMVSSSEVDDCTPVESQVTMTVNEEAVVSFSINASATTICAGEAVIFSPGPINNGGTSPSYQWLVNDAAVSGATSKEFTTSSLNDKDRVSLEVTSYVKCATPVPAKSSNEIEITVQPDATISLASGNTEQTVCVNTSISAITYNIGGTGNDATVTDLPSGVTGSYSNGKFTISGSSDSPGTYNYTVTATGTCADSESLTGTLTIDPDATISEPSNKDQTVCINTAISSIDYNIGGGGTGAEVTGLPDGLSSSFSNGVFRISGTPTEAGDFSYTVSTTGTCAQVSTSGTISVTPDASLTEPANINEVICIDQTLNSISFTIGGGATGASVSGLPAGVSGSLSSDQFTISGTPTESGEFTYTVTTAGSCVQDSATGTISVTANATISEPANKDQSLCIDSALDGIVFTIGGGATGATASGLPAGLQTAFTGDQLTISGTPTESGVFEYTISTSGTCVQTTATGTISVTANAGISQPANKDQSLCINSSLNSISFTVTGGATGATVSGLPAGVEAAFSGDQLNITGTPTESGTFGYTVSTTGDCVQTSTTGTITVNPDATLELISGPSTQTVCAAGGVSDGAITPIVYSIGETGTGAEVSNLPSGITGSYNSSDNTFTISGSTTSTGTFNYTVTATGSCGGSQELTGSITVTGNLTPAVSIASGDDNNIICSGGSITFTATPENGGSTPQYQWQINGNNVAGANSATFSTTALQDSDIVSVILTSSETCLTTQSAASNSIEIQVDDPVTGETPVFSTEPGTNPTGICPVASGLTYTVDPIPGATSYHWVFPSGWTITAGENTNTVTVTAGSTAKSGNVTVVGRNECGDSNQTSLELNVDSFAYASAGPDQVVCAGTTFIQLAGEIGGVITKHNQYEWSADVTGGTFPSGNNKLNGEYTLPSSIVNGGVVNVTITTIDPDGPCEAVTDTMQITVLASPEISSPDNKDQTICLDSPLDPIDFNISGSGNGATVTGLPAGITGNYAGNIFTLSGIPTESGSFNYTVTTTAPETTSGTCTQATQSGTITVNPLPSVTPPADVVACNEGTIAEIILSGSGVAGTTYHWENSNPDIGLPASGSGNIASFTASNTSSNPVTATITVTPVASGCPGPPETFTITVNPTATVTKPDNIVACNDGSISQISFTGSSVSGTTYQWSNDNTAIGLGANGTGDIAAFTAQNSGIEPITAQITVTPIANDCEGVAETFTITVNPTPVADKPTNITACNGETVSETILSGAVNGTTYTWSNSNTSIGLAAEGTGNIPSFDATNTTSQPVTATITIIPTANACEGPAETFTITVNPNITVTKPEAVVACDQESVSGISFSGSVTGTSYKWVNDNTSIGLAASGTGDIAAFTATNSTSAPITANITVTPYVDDCEGTPENFTITVNPTPTVTQPTDIVACDLESIPAISLGGSSVNNTVYNWSNDNTAIGLSSSGSGDIPAFTATNDSDSPITATITIIPVANDCEGPQQSFSITVNPTPTVTNPGNMVACNGESVSEIILSGSVSGTSYTWSNSNEAIGLAAGGTGNIPAFTATNSNTTNDPITATITITPEANACEGGVEEFTITVNPTTTVTVGEDQTICSTGTATMAASLGGGATSGTWSTSGSGVFSDQTPTAVYTPSSTDINTGAVTLTYTTNDPDGPCNAVSDSLILTIKEEVVITTQPQNVGVCVTNQASLSVVAYGDDLSYQWYKGNAPGTAVADSGNISGANEAELKFNQAKMSDAGTYYVVVSGDDSCEAITSREVTLNVNEDINFETQPVSQTVCEGTDVTFTAVATGSIESYQWRKNGNPISGANSASYTITSATVEDSDTYDLVITGTGGTCPEAYSEIATLVVNPAPVITSIGEDIQMCVNGEGYVISGGASVSDAAYIEWTVPSGAGTISDATSLTDATFSPAENVSSPIILTLTAYGLEGCAEVSATKEIHLEPLPTVDSITYDGGSIEFCDNSDVVAPVVSGTNAFEGGTYSWSPAAGEAAGNMLLLVTAPETGYAPGAIKAGSDPGVYDITYSTPAGAICEVVSKTIQISITKLPVASFTYADSPFCKTSANPVAILDEGSTSGIFSSTTGLLFADDSTGEIDLAGSTAGTYTITNTIVAANGCEEVSDSFEITINEEPVADFAYSESQVCSDSPDLEPIFTGDAVPGVFSEKNGDNGIKFETATGKISVSESEPGNYIIVNTLEIEGDGCEAVSAEFSISINQKPDPVFTYNNGGGYCITDGVASVTEGFETGGTFSSASLGSYLDVTTGEINWSATNTSITGDHKVIYTIEGTGGCEDVFHEVIINIAPEPIGGELNFEGFGRVLETCSNPGPDYSVSLNLTGQTGQIIRWRYAESSHTAWTTILQNGENYTGTTLTAEQIRNLGINETTIFEVEIGSGACSPNVYSQNATLSIISSDISPNPVTATPGVVCTGEEVTLTGSTGYGSGSDIVGGAFDNSAITNHGWRIRRDGSTKDLNFDSSADNTRPSLWLRTNPHDFHTADIHTHKLTLQRWDSGAEDNKGFAIVSGNNPSTMETPVFNTYAMEEATLTFDQAYNLTAGDTIRVEISTDGGETYSTILYEVSGPATSKNYGNFGTSTASENNISIDLSSYLGQENLRIRFHYMGQRDGAIWAVDDIKIPEGPVGVDIIWRDNTDPDNPVPIGSETSFQYTPSLIGWNEFKITNSLTFDNTGDNCPKIENSSYIKVFVFDRYKSTASSDVGPCGNQNIHLEGAIINSESVPVSSFPTLDGYEASWKVVSGPDGYEFSEAHFSNGESSLPAVNDPQAVFSPGLDGSYTLRWNMERNVDDDIKNEFCPPEYSDVTVEIQPCIALDFDGLDDYVDLGENYTGTYSIEAWIRPEAATGTIITGPNFEINVEDLPAGVQTNSRWYHIAVQPNGTLFVDGIQMGSISNTGSSERAFIGARWNAPNAENHFSGWIEEVRIWNGTISQEQIQFLMNQRLQDGANIGVEIPMPAPGMGYADLAGYYQLLADPAVILNGGYTPDLSGSPVDGKLRNMQTFQENTAPLPYYSAAAGPWTQNNTWAEPDVWDIPNAAGVSGDPIEWNIVRTSHDITSQAKDITVLGLKSEAGELRIANPSGAQDENNTGQMLRITHYLDLHGVIDLVGESQLLQDTGSIVDAGSTGFLERDQQGIASSYNYNYWSSPVSPGTGNAPYTVGAVLRDGTNTDNYQELNFNYKYAWADGGYTDPRRMSTYWIHRFNGTAGDYGQWIWIGATGEVKVGEGYYHKGTSGTAPMEDLQNYTFIGKPNNGPITLDMAPGRNYFVGNPYASGLDADEFIRDNMKDVSGGRNHENVFNGTLYFWSHFEITSHYLSEYIGGYAIYNLSGGTRAVSNDPLIDDNNQVGGEEPDRYIAVAQGFIVSSVGDNVTGGDLKFRNSQRAYKREGEESVFHKPEDNIKKNKTAQDTRSKIWLNFRSPTGYHRQILVTADPATTNGFDLGYDAYLIENHPEDMYWHFNDSKFVIQGVPHFNEDQELDLGIKVEEEKTFTIEIDMLRNIPDDMEIFLRDSLLNTYHDLRKGAYKSTSEPGVIEDRFKLVFKGPQAAPEEEEEILSGDLQILYVNGSREVIIRNPELYDISKIYLNNILGQQVHMYYDIPTEQEIKLPVARFSAGVYVIKLHSAEKGILTKKIIIE